ncbi:hypothetical protein CEXT_548581 [Caerostris extrusa]|uniref:Uncharacterized protein n=1 Tax=Caerostris extrusa TaxID=172846 RepID=A0AAV4Y847_CAEEX|nr:hypothetical protein CEXT_548581 [Caerostris extrusa]
MSGVSQPGTKGCKRVEGTRSVKIRANFSADNKKADIYLRDLWCFKTPRIVNCMKRVRNCRRDPKISLMNELLWGVTGSSSLPSSR